MNKKKSDLPSLWVSSQAVEEFFVNSNMIANHKKGKGEDQSVQQVDNDTVLRI